MSRLSFWPITDNIAHHANRFTLLAGGQELVNGARPAWHFVEVRRLVSVPRACAIREDLTPSKITFFF